jgi:hypothetical protein
MIEIETDPLDQIEHDPITIAKSRRDRIIARELARLPDEFHDKVLRQPLSELTRRIRSAIESFRNDQIDGALTDFAHTLRDAVAFELANNPALKPWSAAAEIKNNSSAFFAEHWNGNETAELQRLITTGRRIRRVTLRAVELDDGSIVTRADVHRDVLSQRPKFGYTISDDKFLEKFFTPERVLLEIENARAITEREQIRKQTTHQSGPPSLIGTPIRN